MPAQPDPIPFDRAHDIIHGAVDELTPLVRRVTANNPSPLTFKGTGTYIVGRGSVAVIDPGPDDDAHLNALLSALDGEEVSHILITHGHHDHRALAPALKQATGAATYAMVPDGARPQAIEGAPDGSVIDDDFAADHILRDGDVIEGSGWVFDAIATPGHTSDHLSFALREERALFCGDHVMSWSTSVVIPPDGSMKDYMASLEKLRGGEHDIYWPTHGGPVRDPQPFLDAYIAHRHAREAEIIRRLEAGDRTIAAMVPEIYPDIDKALYPAASMSVLAHLIYLAEKGEVGAEPAPTVNARYMPTGSPS